MQARLTDLAFGTTKSIDKPWFRIGRCKPYVDLCVVNIAVSRSHCEIFSKTGFWYLRDQNSTNYTYLNGTSFPRAKNTGSAMVTGSNWPMRNIALRRCCDGRF